MARSKQPASAKNLAKGKGSGYRPKPRYSPAEIFVAVVGVAFLVLLAGLVVTSLLE